MDAYINVLRHSGAMLVDMDALNVNSNHLANDPGPQSRPPQEEAHPVRR